MSSKKQSNCKCKDAPLSGAGGSPFEIKDFTSDFTSHFDYSYWDEYHVFTCTSCNRVWFLQCDHVDRPPYLNRAYRINSEQLEGLMKFSRSELERIITQKGIRSIKQIIDGEKIAFELGNEAPEDN